MKITLEELQEQWVKNLVSIVERKKQPDEEETNNILEYYKNFVACNKESLLKTVSLIEDLFEQDKKLYFLNSKVYKNKKFHGLINNPVNNKYTGVLGLTREALYELGYTDNSIIEVDKNIDKNMFIEIFTFNNMFGYQAKFLSDQQQFEENTNEKYQIYWQKVFENSVAHIPDFETHYERIEEYASEQSLKGNFDIDSEDYYQEDFTVEPAPLEDLNYLLIDLFDLRDKKVKNQQYNQFTAILPTLSSAKDLNTYIAKDVHYSIKHDNAIPLGLSFLDVSLGLGAFKDEFLEGNANFNIDLFNDLIRYINEPEKDDFDYVKKIYLMSYLNRREIAFLKYGVDYEPNLEKAKILYDFINSNKEIFNYNYGYVKYLNEDNVTVNSQYKYAITYKLEDISKSFYTTDLKKELAQTALKELSENFKTKKLYFIEKNFILTILSTEEINKEVMRELLKKVIDETIEVKKEYIKANKINQHSERCFDNETFEKMYREELLTLNLYSNSNREKTVRKSLKI